MSQRILIVEDEPLINADLAAILVSQGYTIAGQAYDSVDAYDIIKEHTIDLALLDIELDHKDSGLDIARTLKDKYQIPFMFITAFSDEQTLSAAQELLPEGYIIKPYKTRDIIASVGIILHRLKAHNQSPYRTLEELNSTITEPITSKEYEILFDMAKGFTNISLAQMHFISINTVKTHLQNIFQKLDVHNRSQAVLKLLVKSQYWNKL